MRKHILMSAIVLACVAALAAAQVPPADQQQNERPGTTTITGCLYHERDVPGRTPNAAERAGIGEDYILAEASGAAAPAKMYKVEELDDNRLGQFIGKRVEVTGRIDDDGDDARQAPTGTSGTEDRSVGPDRIELPELEATSIREVAGTCPAKPSAPGAAMSETQSGAARTEAQTATEAERQSPAPVTRTPTYPAPQPQPQPPAPTPSAPVTRAPTHPETDAPQPATITLTGCLYRERDVPGRTPNVAERAGILEDYILADAQVSPSASSPAGTPSATGTSGATPAIGRMFKVEHVADERLAQFVGKRVEVIGKIDTEEGEMKQAGTAGTTGTTPDRSAGPDRIELPEFEATSIREIAGTCPATPSQN